MTSPPISGSTTTLQDKPPVEVAWVRLFAAS